MAGATVEMQSHEGDITVRVTTALSNREKEEHSLSQNAKE